MRKGEVGRQEELLPLFMLVGSLFLFSTLRERGFC